MENSYGIDLDLNTIKVQAKCCMKSVKHLILILICLSSLTAQAKLFRNPYISFELPPSWDCRAEGTEWICVNKHSQRTREAIIILTAKEIGPTDSLASYLAHLKIPKNLKLKSGKTIKSKVLHVKQRTINDHVWVDSIHLGSEVQNYYTRYLLVIKDRIAVLVTFSAHKRHYTKYSNDFFKTIQSLRLIAPKNIFSKNPKVLRPSNETIGAPIGSAIPSDLMSEEFPEEISSQGNSDTFVKLLAVALIFVALGVYFIMKRRKKTQ